MSRVDECIGINPPGSDQNYPFKISDEDFVCRKRTFHDQTRIRAYAVGLCQMAGASAIQAVAMVDAEGLEFQQAKLAIVLVEAPDHWKSSKGHMAPELLDFDQYAEQFSEVYVEVVRFHNTFRDRTRLRDVDSGKSETEEPGTVENTKTVS